MFTTNSFVASTFESVSFCKPSFRITVENKIVGGFEQTPLKKLNGARFRIPSLLIVETSAIGLGTIEPIINL
jgi:hypothetical protein